MPVIAFADGVQRGASHVDVFAGLRIRSGRLHGGPAFTLGADQDAIFVGNVGGAIRIVGKAGVVRLAFFVLAVGMERAFSRKYQAGLLVRALGLPSCARRGRHQKHSDNRQSANLRISHSTPSVRRL